MQAESNCVRHADIELVECLELILAKLPFLSFFKKIFFPFSFLLFPFSSPFLNFFFLFVFFVV